MPFRLLLVCTGNVCRSPMAERLLVAGLAERSGEGGRGVEVSSAGTGALVGEAMTPETADLVSRHGGDPTGHRARQVTPQLLAEADLVLALTREHRAAVAQLHPRVLRRLLTLREAGRLAPLVAVEGLPEPVEDRWRALVPAMLPPGGACRCPARATTTSSTRSGVTRTSTSGAPRRCCRR